MKYLIFAALISLVAMGGAAVAHGDGHDEMKKESMETMDDMKKKGDDAKESMEEMKEKGRDAMESAEDMKEKGRDAMESADK